MDLIPEPAPNLRQLLAFYLEAGVDCALTEEPVDRLSEPEAPTAPAPVRETAPPAPARDMPAATPAVPRSETAVVPEAAIALARDAARTAPTITTSNSMDSRGGSSSALMI
jgi:DNA polymerase